MRHVSFTQQNKVTFLAMMLYVQDNKAEVTRFRGIKICPHCKYSVGHTRYKYNQFSWDSELYHLIDKHDHKPKQDFFDMIMSFSENTVENKHYSETKPHTKEKFGHVTDGPSTTFLPETLKAIMIENNVNAELVVEVMATINAQSMVSYNEGYADHKERSNRTKKD